MKSVALAIVASSLVAVGAAQSPASLPAFEVASVKRVMPSAGPTTVRPGGPQPGGRWTASNATLGMILNSVYREFAVPNRIVGGPDWISRELFEIDARSTPDATAAQLNLMARQLLADRFALRTHTERREFEVYTLTVARADGRLGAALRPQKLDCADARNAANSNVADIDYCRQRSERGQNGTVRIIGRSMAIAGGLTTLIGTLDRPVVDRTGLTGWFDFEIEFVPQRALQSAGGDVPSGASIFTAMQEQLGLKLEPSRESLDVLVIDSVSLPAPD